MVTGENFVTVPLPSIPYQSSFSVLHHHSYSPIPRVIHLMRLHECFLLDSVQKFSDSLFDDLTPPLMARVKFIYSEATRLYYRHLSKWSGAATAPHHNPSMLIFCHYNSLGCQFMSTEGFLIALLWMWLWWSCLTALLQCLRALFAFITFCWKPQSEESVKVLNVHLQVVQCSTDLNCIWQATVLLNWFNCTVYKGVKWWLNFVTILRLPTTTLIHLYRRSRTTCIQVLQPQLILTGSTVSIDKYRHVEWMVLVMNTRKNPNAE